MKLSKEDIQNYGTEDEKKILTEVMQPVLRKRGRPSTKSQIMRHKIDLEFLLKSSKQLFDWENWGELTEQLQSALYEAKKIMNLTKTDYTFGK